MRFQDKNKRSTRTPCCFIAGCASTPMDLFTAASSGARFRDTPKYNVVTKNLCLFNIKHHKKKTNRSDIAAVILCRVACIRFQQETNFTKSTTVQTANTSRHSLASLAIGRIMLFGMNE